MTQPAWSLLVEVEVKAKPDGLWTKACDYVAGPRKLRFTVVISPPPAASPTWVPNRTIAVPATASAPAQPIYCGADGLPGDFRASNLCASAPTGAIIAKIGGSTADKPEAAGVFAVGSYCVRQMKAEDGGALFLTMNDEPGGFAQHDGVIKVKIEEAP